MKDLTKYVLMVVVTAILIGCSKTSNLSTDPTTTPMVSVSEISVLREIEAGRYSADFNKPGIAIRSLVGDGKPGISNTVITVDVLEGQTSDFYLPSSEVVYQILRISQHADMQNPISNLEIQFNITKEWAVGRKITPNQIILKFWEEDWKPAPIDRVQSDERFISIKGTIPKLALIAIIGRSDVAHPRVEATPVPTRSSSAVTRLSPQSQPHDSSSAIQTTPIFKPTANPIRVPTRPAIIGDTEHRKKHIYTVDMPTPLPPTMNFSAPYLTPTVPPVPIIAPVIEANPIGKVEPTLVPVPDNVLVLTPTLANGPSSTHDTTPSPIPTHTASPTYSLVLTSTPTPTTDGDLAVAIPSLPLITFVTSTSLPSPNNSKSVSPGPSPQSTSTLTPTPSSTPTALPTPTVLPTPTALPTPTSSPSPTATMTPVPLLGDDRFGVIAHSATKAHTRKLLEKLGVKTYITFNPDMSQVPDSAHKIPYISVPQSRDVWVSGKTETIESLTDNELSNLGFLTRTEIRNMAMSAPGSYWYMFGEANRYGYITGWKFAKVFHYLYSQIKIGDPTARIIGPSLLNWDYTCLGCPGFFFCETKQVQGYPCGKMWLKEFIDSYTYQYGVEPPVDVWALDSYPLDWRIPTDWGSHAQTAVNQMIGLREFLDTVPKYRNTPIWVTEIAIHVGYDGWEYTPPPNPKIKPVGDYKWEKLSDYMIDVIEWLDQNGELYQIEKWFFYTSWQDVVNDISGGYMGIIFLNGPSEDASLNCLGAIYRAWSLDESRVKCDANGNTVTY